jgi:hypothetical protein
MVIEQQPIFMTSYKFDSIVINEMTGNKLFCTFIDSDNLNETVDLLKNRYSILYNKIFVLSSPDTDEYILTYNIDVINTNSKNALPNTILVHRKKEFNSLYSVNALNEIIKSLNGGVIDTNFSIPWSEYKNCLLLTQDGGLRRLNTKIYNIIT